MKTVYPTTWTLPKVEGSLPESVHTVICECGGTANQVDLTKEEIKNPKINCGRSYACCGRAFVCKKCKTRMIGKIEPPDMG